MILMAGVIAFTSCGDDTSVYGPENLVGKPAANVITIEKASLDFQCTAGQGAVTCISTNPLTAVETNAAWCTATLNGNTVNVSVTANPDLQTRVARLRIYAGNDYKDVTVQQFGTVICINNGDNLTVNASPQSTDLDINYTGGGNLSIVSGDVDWANFTIVDGNKLHIDFEVNAEENARSTELTLSDGEATTAISIEQGGLYFIVNEGKDFTSDNSALTKNITIETVDGINYSVAASTVSWATFSIANGNLRVVLQANTSGKPRRTTATITYAGTLTKEITITQYDFMDILGNYKIIYGSNGGSFTTGTLESDGNGGYQMRFTDGDFATIGAVLPINVNTTDQTIEIVNCTPMQGSYTTGGVTYDLMALVMYSRSGSAYINSNTAYAAVGKFNLNDDGSATIDFKANSAIIAANSANEYYAIRLIYTNNGYTGRKTHTTFSYMYWEKQ